MCWVWYSNGTSPFNVIYSDGFNNVALNGISSPYNFQTNSAGTYTLKIRTTDAGGLYDECQQTWTMT